MAMRIEEKRILIILTGGTISMRRDPLQGSSLVPVRGYLKESLELMLTDSRTSYKYPQCQVLEYPIQLDSSDMGPDDWKRIALDIEENYKKYDGFIVVMGTDTLSFCASALSFMLGNLTKTVVITGAMLPMERAETDARRNLMVSLVVAAVSNIPEVVVVFRDYVFRGCRVKKLDSVSMNSFHSPNFPPLAIIEDELQIRRSLSLPIIPTNKLDVRTSMDENILAIRLVPGYRNDIIFSYLDNSGLKGLILELYGAGNAPKSLELTHAITKAVSNGIVVVIVSQCPKGHVDLEHYASGRQMLECGAISVGDMTFEACSTKLAFLLGQGITDRGKLKELMQSSLRGEITVSLLPEARFRDSIVVKDVDHFSSRI